MMPKVSIIVPIYNMQNYLEECLDSLIHQTLEDIEIICINDCSTDNSLSIINEYAKKDERIKVIDLKENHGWSYAQNTGLKNVTGKYVMFVDSDDWLELNACEKAYNAINKNNDDFVYFTFKYFYEKDNSFKVNTSRLRFFVPNFEEGKSFNFKEMNEPFMGFGEDWYKIYSYEFLTKNDIRFPDEYKFISDISFYIKAIVCSQKVSYINVPLYNYRIRMNNSVASPKNYKNLIGVRAIAYNIVMDTKDDFFIKYYIIAHIGSYLAWYKKWTQMDKSIEHDFYNKMRNEFIRLEKTHDIEKIKQYIKYKTFKKIIKNNWYQKRCKEILKKIFSVCNSNDKKHKIITILGIKMKIRKHIS